MMSPAWARKSPLTIWLVQPAAAFDIDELSVSGATPREARWALRLARNPDSIAASRVAV
jgi:hypothetical protein